MANVYISHHKFPANPQLFAVSLHKVVGIGVDEREPGFNPTFPTAEPTWKVFIYTSGLDATGRQVGPVAAGFFGSAEDVNKFIETKIADLCYQIDWSQQGQFQPEEDNWAPQIVEHYPSVSQENVPINSSIVIRVKDFLPANGVDLSTVSMVVDGFTVNPRITGNKYDYTFIFTPKPIFFD